MPAIGKIGARRLPVSLRRNNLMSTAAKSPDAEPIHEYLVRRTIEACALAKEAAGAAAEGIATGSAALLSFANSAQAAGGRLDSDDTRDLTQIATILEKMLTDVGSAFSARDVNKAVEVLRADAEMDRLRNLIFLRHIENPENVVRQASLQVIFMTQSLERAGDHAKNLAEEVCHFVSGRTVRHVLMAYDKPVEQQLFMEKLRRREGHRFRDRADVKPVILTLMTGILSSMSGEHFRNERHGVRHPSSAPVLQFWM